MKISKGLKIGLIVGSSAIAVGGAVMMFVGGMATYTGVKITTDPLGVDTNFNVGCGLFNFDNKGEHINNVIKTGNDGITPLNHNDFVGLLDKQFAEYGERLGYKNKQEMVDSQVRFSETKIQNIRDSKDETQIAFQIPQIEADISFIKAMASAPTNNGLAITGIVFLPIALVALLGSILFFKVKSKDKTE